MHYANCKQQAKVDWLIHGDKTTRIFFAEMSIRRYKNNIQALLNQDEEAIYENKQIENEALNFYTNLHNGPDSMETIDQQINCRRINAKGR